MVGLFAISLRWLGLLIGVAFLATPVKFLAPCLTMAVAFDVGRYTFAAFNKVEWLCAVALLAICAEMARLLLPDRRTRMYECRFRRSGLGMSAAVRLSRWDNSDIAGAHAACKDIY